MKKSADIKLGYECNDKCVHCVVEKLRDIANKNKSYRNLEEYKKEVLKKKEKGITHIIITGGEPTIRHNFLEIISFLKSENLTAEIQSNGRKFSDYDFAKQTSNYIKKFTIALHGPNKEIHDQITQTKGSFNETVKGLENLVNLKVDIWGKIVLSIHNYKSVTKTLEVYKKIGVKKVVVSFPHSSGEEEYIEKIAPYYKDIQPHIEESLNTFTNPNEFLVVIEDILPCTLKKTYPIIHYFEFFETVNNKKKQLDTIVDKPRKWGSLRQSIKRKSENCSKCIFNNFCDGIWKEYVDLRGFDEFKPIETTNMDILFKYKKDNFNL